MRLDFNVLWVEDNTKYVLSQRDKISQQIRKEGFRLEVKFAATLIEASSYLSSDIFGDHIDLVLMDYDLGSGGRGDDGLLEVRRLFPYKDLIFYSAQTDNLASLVAMKKVEGVFCSDRDGLPDEVIGLFHTLIKKVLDIDHARGIVMGSSSDIDGLVLDGLKAHSRDGGGVLSQEAKEMIADQLKEIRKSFEKNAAKVESAETVAELHKLHLVYSSAHRHRLLRKLLEKKAEFESFCDSMNQYSDATIPKRNVLAHVRVKKDGFARKLFDASGHEITGESVRQLRLELLEHQETLEKLIDVLSNP